MILPSFPQISEKLKQVLYRRKEMNERWEARWERLRMCEYLWDPEPAGEGVQMPAEVGAQRGDFHCLEMSPRPLQHHSSARFWGPHRPVDRLLEAHLSLASMPSPCSPSGSPRSG